MKKTKTQKGITLIALIITIVVLLILAAVTISAIQGDGIIAKATNARDKYNQAQTDEGTMLSELESYLSNNAGPWIQDKTVVKNIQTGQTLAVGDTVNYNAGVSAYTGRWKVLGAENGEVLLLSTKDVGWYELSSSEQFTTYVADLDNLCEGYDAGVYARAGSARSIRVEDIDRITGYDKTTYGKGTVEEYGNKVTYTLGADGDTLSWVVEGNTSITGSLKLSELETNSNGSIQTLRKPDGTTIGKGESYTVGPLTQYSYEFSSDFSTLLNTLLEDTEVGQTLGLASVYVGISSSGIPHWGHYHVGPYEGDDSSYKGTEFYSGISFYGPKWDGYYGPSACGIYAVVSLNSEVTFTSAGANAWNLPTE